MNSDEWARVFKKAKDGNTMSKYFMKYLLNPGLKAKTEKVFEGIANGRQKALQNWFEDKWLQLEFVKDGVSRYLESNKGIDFKEVSAILSEKR